MEHTTARRRQKTIEGVFTPTPGQARLAELVDTKASAPIVLATPKHNVVAYGSKPPLPETFDVRVARVLDEKLAPIFEMMAAFESKQLTSAAQIKMVAKDVLTLREAVLKAAAIHVRETQETRRIAADVERYSKPLAKRAVELEAEKMKKNQIVSAWRNFLRVMWDNKEVFVGTLFTIGVLFCISCMVYYLVKH